jgi:hypothetical protein
MTSNKKAQRDELPNDWGGTEDDFSEEELPPLSEEELRETNRRSDIFLEQERAEREALAEQFEEELDALFATIKPGDRKPEEEKGGNDPPGWPDL